MEAIILAAGRGKRLNNLLNGRPKCLLEVGGRPLIDRLISVLLELGVEKIILCIGYGAEEIKKHVIREFNGCPILYVYNPFYNITNNSFTLWLARNTIKKDFLLINGDNVLDQSLITKVYRHEGTVIPIVRKREYDGEDMKVKVTPKGYVSEISKDIRDNIYGEAIGIRKVSAGDYKAFKSALNRLVLWKRRFQSFYTEVFQDLIDRGLKIPCLDTSDFYYDEIDDEGDWVRINKEFTLKESIGN